MTQLPLGQIRPAAQPVNAFFQPGKANVAAATAQPSVPRMPQLGTQTQRGGFNVQGYNSFEQLAKSLSVFSKEALSLGKNLALNYVSDQIKAGYEAEVKNQTALAAVNIQNDLEESAADAANEIAQLEKVDPPAAELLTDSNPYRLIGRRRAAAQLAKGDVRGAVLGLLTTDAARLATLKPGSPELTKMRVEVTRQVAQKYGLSGSEPEFIKYVLPEINESWDIFSTRQAKMFNDELKINTQNLVIADVANTIPFMLSKGAPDENGQLIAPGMPKFYGAASRELTRIVDNHMRLLPPAARREVMQNLQTELFGTLARDPFAQRILQGIRGGNPALPMELRPALGETNRFQNLQTTVAGTRAQVDLVDLNNKAALQQFMQRDFYGPGGLAEYAETDPGFADAYERAEQRLKGLGHTQPQVELNRMVDQNQRKIQRTQMLDLPSLDTELERIRQLPLENFSGELLTELRRNNIEYIKNLPSDQQRREAREALNQQVQKGVQRYENMRTYINSPLQSNLLTVTANPVIQKAIGKKQADGLAEFIRNDAANPAAAITEEKARQAIELIRRRLIEVGEAALLPLEQGTPDSTKESEVGKAMSKFLQSPEYTDLINSLQPPAPVQPQAAVPAGPVVYGREQAADITPGIAANYKKQPVLSGKWVRAEQQALSVDENAYSEQLRKAAADAKVTPARYLFEHIQRYYPKLDADGSFRRFLRFQMLKQKQNDTVSFNQPGMSFDGQKVAYVPNDITRPGGWLMGMLAGALTPADKELLRNYAEQMRINGSREAIKEIQRLNIQYRQYGLAFPLA